MGQNKFCALGMIVLFLAINANLSGCALLLVGGGAAGGYAVSKDEVKGAVSASQDRVYREALKVAKSKGLIDLQDQAHGRIDVMVEDVRVKIHVRKLTESATELRVEARNKLKMPRVAVAQDVYTEILKKVD